MWEIIEKMFGGKKPEIPKLILIVNFKNKKNEKQI
jgi:hypothetical protein